MDTAPPECQEEKDEPLLPNVNRRGLGRESDPFVAGAPQGRLFALLRMTL
jgi:hypothetical protein